MREAIDNYTLDKQQAPQSLHDLVNAHYLREMPIDPVNQQNDWIPHYGDTVLTPDQTRVGMDDVISGPIRSEATALRTPPGDFLCCGECRSAGCVRRAHQNLTGSCRFAIVTAGWSSLVARRAHNPKVVSSNLTPATN